MELNIGDQKWSIKKEKQKGFTLVNLAGLVVSGGLALGVVVQGPGVVSDFRYAGFYSELKDLESQVWEYRDEEGRWPGDCRADGVIELKPENQVNWTLQEASQDNACLSTDELREAGLIDVEKLNQVGLKHDYDDLFQLGHAVLDKSEAKAGNVIVAYGVPTSLANWLDFRVDGNVDGEQGRIRRWDQQDQGSMWPEDTGQTVAIAYFIDQKIPE